MLDRRAQSLLKCVPLKAEASRVKTSILQDPNVLDLHCEDFNTLEGSNSSISEFGDLTALTAVVILSEYAQES